MARKRDTKTHHSGWRAAGWSCVIGVVLLLAALVAAPRLVAAQEFGQPVAGRHVYDEAGILTPTEVQYLEEATDRVAAAGAPAYVYIQTKQASQDETQQDAADLMAAWAIESSPGAKDGLVVFFNSDPDNPGHGEVALYAGQTLYDGGNLPERELRRIFDDAMRDPMRRGETAVGIAAGLDAAAYSLQNGPPPPDEPSQLEKNAGTVARWPLSILGGLAALGGLVWAVGRWNARPASTGKSSPTTELPSRLPPAIAGALVTGEAGPSQAIATVLDLAARGAIAFEPAERGSRRNRKVQILLVDESLARGPYEQELWRTLQRLADPFGVVRANQLSKLPGAWKGAHTELRCEMESRGWWSPASGKQRRPFYLAAAGLLVVSGIAGVVAAIGREPVTIAAIAAMTLAALVCFGLGGMYPPTTAEGAAAAMSWQGLKSGLRASRRSSAALDLDALLPYAMAMGEFGSVAKRLKDASATGYVPLAFRQSLHADDWAGGFYPYFTSFTAASNPSSSGAGSASASGAAAGGGGAGGSV